MNINETVQQKREDILRLATKHGAYNVRLFGSVARNEADEQSDIVHCSLLPDNCSTSASLARASARRLASRGMQVNTISG